MTRNKHNLTFNMYLLNSLSVISYYSRLILVKLFGKNTILNIAWSCDIRIRVSRIFWNFIAETTLTRRMRYEIRERKSYRLAVWDAKGSQFALDYFPDASVPACATNQPTVSRKWARFNKTRWILLTRTYVVERFWAEFEIHPSWGDAGPSHRLLPSIVLFLTKRALFFFLSTACAAREKWKTASTVEGTVMHDALFAANKKTRMLAMVLYCKT